MFVQPSSQDAGMGLVLDPQPRLLRQHAAFEHTTQHDNTPSVASLLTPTLSSIRPVPSSARQRARWHFPRVSLLGHPLAALTIRLIRWCVYWSLCTIECWDGHLARYAKATGTAAATETPGYGPYGDVYIRKDFLRAHSVSDLSSMAFVS